MKVKNILLFLTNFITVSISVNEREGASKSIAIEEKIMDQSSFDKRCSVLSKKIHNNNISDLTINCKNVHDSSGKYAEEIALQNACRVVSVMLYHICDKKLEMNSDNLSLNVSNKIAICPFNFTQLIDPKEYISVEKELTNKHLCEKVCYDLDQLVKQCIVLHKVNEYLKNVERNFLQVPPQAPEAAMIEPLLSGDNNQKTEIKVSDKSKTEPSVLQKNEAVIKDVGNTKSKVQEAVSKDSEHVQLTQGSQSDRDVQNLSKENIKPMVTVPSKEVKSTTSWSEEPVKEERKIESPEDDYEVQNDSESIVDQGQRPENSPNNIKVSAPQMESSQESERSEVYSREGFFQAEDSHFFFYFLMFSSVIIIGYLAFHNKNKIVAYALEGRNSRRSRRRPNPARYRKLESNLEEAIASSASHTAASSVVY